MCCLVHKPKIARGERDWTKNLLHSFYDQMTVKCPHVKHISSFKSNSHLDRYSQKSHQIIILLCIIGSLYWAGGLLAGFTFAETLLFYRFGRIFLLLYVVKWLDSVHQLSAQSLSSHRESKWCAWNGCEPFFRCQLEVILKSKVEMMIIKSSICLMVFVSHFVSIGVKG